MYQQKIGISIGNNYVLPIRQVIGMLKNIGFDAISPEWITEEALGEMVDAAKENGLLVQSLHAPFAKAADMWSDDENRYMPAKNEMLACLAACVKFSIPVLVVHTWIGFDYRFDPETLNFRHFEEIVAFAKQNNIKIAFENTEGEEYLFALMAHFEKNDTVGFCWDSGHEMCFNRSQDLLAKFGDRLIITHLNDNLGISRFDGQVFWLDDLHLLPYDGIADWDYNIDRLKKANDLPILNFELNIHSKPHRHENDVYSQMPLEQYFTQAYIRACKIAYRYSK